MFGPIIIRQGQFRSRHFAWENGRDSLTVVGLHENWTLVLRFQVSGVRSENARAGLKPDTRHLKPMLRKGFIKPDNVQKRAIFKVNYQVCSYLTP
jgi:hypothetical protein